MTNKDIKGHLEKKRATALAMAEETFNKLDTAGDGLVDVNEILKLFQQGLGLPQLPEGANAEDREIQIDQFFTSFDFHREGKIAKNEWLSFHGDMYDDAIDMKRYAD